MPAQTPTALLKAQLNLDHSFDDALLAHKLAAAETWIAAHTGVAFDADNAAATEAALQLAAYWYEFREGGSDVSVKAIPFGVRDLLASIRLSITAKDQGND
ncbi:head-tail connector protein [Sulfitobacter sp.]|uniref:head-tail connector protein n=1 Tax=Sulfitobacter sp. TaxID=1903071 RepID=UPI003001F30B